MGARGSGIGGRRDGTAVPEPAERRQAGRIDVAIRATIHCSELAGMFLAAGRVVDISGTGVRILTRRRLVEGSSVDVDIECEVPLRVHLGFDAHSLVVDGPMHTHLARVAGVVTRAVRRDGSGRVWEVGIEFLDDLSGFGELQHVQFFVEHLREQEAWGF